MFLSHIKRAGFTPSDGLSPRPYLLLFCSDVTVSLFACSSSVGRYYAPTTQHQNVFKCLYTNLDGTLNKREKLNLILSEVDPDLILLMETKLNQNVMNSEVFVSNYNVYRKDRAIQADPAGGVAILVKDTLVSSDNNVQFLINHEYTEAVWCEVTVGDESVLVGSVCGPPSTNREMNSLLHDLIKLADDHSKYLHILLCGDFNFGGIVWGNNDVNEDDHHTVDSRIFLDVINDCFLNQRVQRFTHSIDNDNPTRLDLVFTNNLMDIENMKHSASVGKSHHIVLEFDYFIDTDYNLEADWDTLFNNKYVVEMYNISVDTCLALIEKYVPKVKCKNT